MMEVIIDGVRYVPVIDSSADMKAIARGLLVSFWGHRVSDENLAEKMKGITVQVYDDGGGDPIEKILTDIAAQLSERRR